jgi:hypothetical protein
MSVDKNRFTVLRPGEMRRTLIVAFEVKKEIRYTISSPGFQNGSTG